MSIDLSRVTGISDSRGVITEIKDSLGRVIWAAGGGKAVLMAEKVTSNTYAGETTYENEQFILLDIYPKTNGTVKVTYGGLTKTITDTSGAAEPNAQKVFFGTFNGVSDNVATPASGELTIEGDYYAFGCASFAKDKLVNYICPCVTKILDFGSAELIPDSAFSSIMRLPGTTGLVGDLVIPPTIKSIGSAAFLSCIHLTSVTIGSGVEYIGSNAFSWTVSGGEVIEDRLSVIMVSHAPPTLEIYTPENGEPYYDNFGIIGNNAAQTPEQIIVPKGCGNTYKTAEGWRTYADLIVEAS